MENVYARNIYILADANGLVEIDYLGQITVRGSIVEEIGRKRGLQILNADDAIVEQHNEKEIDLANNTTELSQYRILIDYLIASGEKYEPQFLSNPCKKLLN